MKILITGAAGFLGSHLCDKLLADGHFVIGVDNFITGNAKNIQHLEHNSNFIFLNQDVRNPLTSFHKYNLDAVMHFASPASPNKQSPTSYFNIPIETLEVNSIGTINALNLARFSNARFLLASTSEIYGDPLVHPQPESYTGNVDTISPRSVYDEAKRFAETLTMTYHRQFKTDTCIVRIFNTYGPRMDLEDGRVLPNLIKQAINNQPLTVYGDGKQTRSFCYVDDLIRGIVLLLYSEEHMPVNIGGSQEISILEFANSINKLTNQDNIIFKDLRSDNDPQRRKPDLTRAKNILNWEPEVGLEEGLRKVLNYYNNL